MGRYVPCGCGNDDLGLFAGGSCFSCHLLTTRRTSMTSPASQGGIGIFDMKHCLTTKSRTSHGPSVHQQKRTSAEFVTGSIKPFRVKNSLKVAMTAVKGGALSTSAWVIPVRAVQNGESCGLQMGFTKLRNSSTTSSLLARPTESLSFQRSRSTGHSIISFG